MFGSLLHSPASKIVIIFILAIIWQTYIAEPLEAVLGVTQWIFSHSFYLIFSEQALQFMTDLVLFVSTYKILLWVFAPNAMLEKQKIDQDIGTSSGFISRPIA